LQIGFDQKSRSDFKSDWRGVAGHQSFQFGCHPFVFAVADFVIVRSTSLLESRKGLADSIDREKQEEKKKSDRPPPKDPAWCAT
jgi:hypothetical protein